MTTARPPLGRRPVPPELVERIRADVFAGTKLGTVADRHGVRPSLVRRILTRDLRRQNVPTRAALSARAVAARAEAVRRRPSDDALSARLFLDLYDTMKAKLTARIAALEAEIARLRA